MAAPSGLHAIADGVAREGGAGLERDAAHVAGESFKLFEHGCFADLAADALRFGGDVGLHGEDLALGIETDGNDDGAAVAGLFRGDDIAGAVVAFKNAGDTVRLQLLAHLKLGELGSRGEDFLAGLFRFDADVFFDHGRGLGVRQAEQRGGHKADDDQNNNGTRHFRPERIFLFHYALTPPTGFVRQPSLM